MIRAEQVVEGYAVLRGKDYAFQLKAPRDWVLDNDSGHDQGLSVVFYPKNSSWASSSAICYARVRTLDDTVKSVEDQVKDTLKVFRENGSIGVQAKYVKTLTTRDASKAKIYYFSEDKYGNYEATAYYQSKDSIHFVTLSCPSRQSFEYSLAAFDALVTSYEDLTKPSTTDANPPPWRNEPLFERRPTTTRNTPPPTAIQPRTGGIGMVSVSLVVAGDYVVV